MPRALLLTGLALALIAVLAVTTFAALAAARGARPTTPVASGSKTPVAQATTTPTVDASPSPTPANAPFVCANAPGSTSTYVFLDADHQLYRVKGCAAPAQLTHLDADTALIPLAFSPTNRYLMVNVGLAHPSDPNSDRSCQNLLNPQTGALTKTSFCEDGTVSPLISRLIGWVDDTTFLEAQFSAAPNSSGVKVMRVNATTLAATLFTTIAWVANTATTEPASVLESGMRLGGGYLYYGGYASASEGGAWLHRVSLADGTDTKLVKLGVAGTGGCQVYGGPCTWTGPWDVTRDGSHVIYHSPGPTQSLSDTTIENDTPLYYANPDGSGAVRLFPNAPLGQGFARPLLSPTGTRVATAFRSPETTQPVPSGAAVALPKDYFVQGWRSDGTALYLFGPQGPNFTPEYYMYALGSGLFTKLAANTSAYVWGV